MNRKSFIKSLALFPLGIVTVKAETHKPEIKSKQKFLRGQRVHINISKDDRSMRYFDSDIDAIVMGSYRDQFGGNDCKSYALLLLDKDDKPYNEVSWYEEHQLTLVDADRDKGEQLCQSYFDKESEEESEEDIND